MFSVKNVSIKLAGRDINIRVYNPEGPGPFPALVYFHGGGWVVGDLDSHDQTCRELAYKTPCVVVAVEYRLSPEHFFPAAVDDCYDSFIWVAENTGELNITPEWLAIGGDSAGANLATVVCMLTRDRKGPPICWQMLVYPVTNLSSFETQSYKERGQGNFLTGPLMEWFRGHYIPNKEDRYSGLASPLLADNLSNLPPAWILTAEHDPLCDEGEAYARALDSAGVSTTCVRYNGMIHPFWLFAGALKATYDAQHEAADAFSALMLKS
jgi:acetyl esterase